MSQKTILWWTDMDLYSFFWIKGIHCLHGSTARCWNFCDGRPPQPAFDGNWRVLLQNLPSINNLCYFNTVNCFQWHQTFIFFFFCSEDIARESKIYTYRKSFNGFVARLLPHEVQSLIGIHNYKLLLSKLMILFPLILYITLALTCSWKEGCISFSKHSAQTSHNENMGLLRNVWNTESSKRSKRERYYCWPLGFRLVFFFLPHLKGICYIIQIKDYKSN